RGLAVLFRVGGRTSAVASQCAPLEPDDEPCQAHRELGEEIVVGDGEGEMEPVPEDGIGERGVHIGTGEWLPKIWTALGCLGTATRGRQSSASAASTSAKLMMVIGSPGFPRWAAAPLRMICREPRAAGMA